MSQWLRDTAVVVLHHIFRGVHEIRTICDCKQLLLINIHAQHIACAPSRDSEVLHPRAVHRNKQPPSHEAIGSVYDEHKFSSFYLRSACTYAVAARVSLA
jgi:hypothetical protein